MAITQVQVSVGTLVSGSAPAPTSFSVLPSAGSLIRVTVAMAADLGSEDVTIADNQGNTYIKAADSGNLNDLRSQIWYTYDIPAPSGTFTVTATPLGGNQSTVIQAKEASGFTPGVDPLTGIGQNTGNSGTATAGPSGSVGASESLVDACVVAYQAPTVETVVPPWVVDYTVGTFESNSRIVSAPGTQSASWSLASSSVWAAALSVFAAAPVDSDVHLDQMARHTLLTAEGQVRMTQITRKVLFDFTTCGAQPPSELRLTQLPIEAAYDYGLMSPFRTTQAWDTPPPEPVS